VPASTSTGKSPSRRPRNPPGQPEPVDPGTGSGEAPASALASVAGNSPPTGGPGRTASPPRGRRRPRPQPPSAEPTRLIDTAGPDPETPLERVRLVVGTILAPHGVRGELKLRPATDAPEQLRHVKRVQIGDDEQWRRLLGARHHGDALLLRVEGITLPEQVAPLRGASVRIHGQDARALAPGEVFLYQLIGLHVVDEAGADLGRVTDLLETGANDVVVVTPAGGGADLLVPFHRDFVLDVAPERGQLVIRPPTFYDGSPADRK
jgi:16S rRNA processing protein RimM